MNRIERIDRKYIVLVIAVLMFIGILIYSYFSSNLITVDGKLSSSDPQFKKALENQLSDSTELLSVVKEDEGPNSDEALKNETKDTIVIPYKDIKSSKPLGILILEKKKNKWMESQDIKLLGESFDEIQLKDLDNDGEDEVIIGISIGKNSTKGVSVFKRYSSGYREIFLENYEKLFVDNFDDDCCNLLVITKKDPNTSSLFLSSYNFVKNEDIKASKIIVGNIDDNMTIKMMNIGKDKKGFVIQKHIDNNKGEITLFTIESGTINALEMGNKSNIVNPYYVDMKDVNGDKVIDIPVLKETQSSIGTDETKQLFITYWKTMNNEFELVDIQREYMSEENDFVFKIPDSWGDKIDVKERREEDSEKNIVSFDTYDDQYNYYNEIIIGIYSTQDWIRMTDEEKEDKSVIYKSEDRVYVLEAESGSEGTDLDSVKSNFGIYGLK